MNFLNHQSLKDSRGNEKFSKILEEVRKNTQLSLEIILILKKIPVIH
jgi:hypothetical protein